MKISFDMSRLDFEELGKRAVKIAHKKAGEKAVLASLSPGMAGRFDGSLQGELGWRARTAKYQLRKLRVKKRGAYMNYSGRTRSVVLRQARNVHVTFRRIRIRLKGLPLYIRRPRRGAKVILRRELRMTRRVEAQTAAEVYAAEFARVLNEDPEVRKKVRKRIG